MNPPRRRPLARALQLLWVASLLLPWLSTYRIALAGEPPWLHVTYGIAALALLGWLLIRYLDGADRPIEWVLSICVINFLVVTPELWLRQSNFHFEPGIQFGYPNPVRFQTLAPDPDLFWRLPADAPGVNSLGFVGHEIERPKPAGWFRVIFLGDSVAQQGYPALVETFLNAETIPSRRFDVANLSTSGYTTYQGRIVADRYALALEPDLVLVEYGWNDHWQAYGSTDSHKKQLGSVAPTDSALNRMTRHVRTLQWLRSAVSRGRTSEHPLTEVRVPLNEYRDNLTYIGEVFTARNIPVVFITAPTSQYALGVPDYLIQEGFASSKDRVLALHKAYNDAVRDLAAAHHWRVLDLETEMSSVGALNDIFIDDGTHLTSHGMAVIAKRVADLIREDPDLKLRHDS